jgi:hypothetical protein
MDMSDNESDSEKPGVLIVEVDISADEEPQSPAFDALLEEARALKPGDMESILGLLAKAARLHLSALEADALVKTIHKSTGLTITALRKTLKTLKEKAQEDEWNAGASQRDRARAAREAQRERERKEERERLWTSCSQIAMSKVLLAAMEALAHELGVVGEGAGVRAAYLTCASRLLAEDAIRLLRLGAPASGKNVVIEIVFRFIPADAIVHVSGGSPKSLPYYDGADNEDALKHKIIYIPEAQIIAAKGHGVESDFAIILRTFISEGRIVYDTVVSQDGGPPTGLKIIKHGPIAAIITTARDVDPELKTRTLIMDTNESGEQTDAIVKRILSKPKGKLNLQPWLDFQLWLELDGPYEVEIPYCEQVYQAFGRWRPEFLKDAQLRMRRDVSSLLNAVKSSAVLHKAQRLITADGVIVATLDDYQHAYEAFDEGLASAHGGASEKVIAVVKAIEAMQGPTDEIGDLPDLSVKVTLRELAKKLRVASHVTAKAHLAAALDYGAIEQDGSMSGRGAPRFFKIIKTSKEIREAPSHGVFPPMDVVRDCVDHPSPRESTDQPPGSTDQRENEKEEREEKVKKETKKTWL